MSAEIQRLQGEIQKRLMGQTVDDRPFLESTPQVNTIPPKVFTASNKQAQTSEGEVVPPCTLETGAEGVCRPLVKCHSLSANNLNKESCTLAAGEEGVCCPLQGVAPTPNPQRNTGVLKSPRPPAVEIPPLTPKNLQTAAESGRVAIEERVNFLVNLLSRGVVVQPGTAAKWHQDFFPTTNETLGIGDEAQKNVEASAALVKEFNLSPEQGKFALPRFSLLNTVLADTCPRNIRCFRAKYRTADGSCNNIKNPHWGQAGTTLQRILPPAYADGVNAPRGEDGRLQLPSARLVSTHFATDRDISSSKYTMLVMQWGQFLDHDLTHTPISRGAGGSGISCCRNGQVIQPELRHPDCFPISLPRNDKIFAPFGERCMEFARSLPAPRPECNFGPREQMNQITSYIDGSNIYGSNRNAADNLRLFRGGFLRAQNVRNRAYLPANPGECVDSTNRLSCFQAGDGRVNEQVDLALMHTIWLREHNRIASILAGLHRNWSDEALYQETKRIVVAQIQHITYNEYLPILLGQDFMDKSSMTIKEEGWSTLYDPTLNAGITNTFATAAFRFGHSQVQSFLHGYGRFGNLRENMELSKNHFSPFVLYQDGAFDDMVRGLAAQPSQTVDRHFSNQITDHLFQGNLDIGLDLFALNIQRGRDHGLPPYNDYREVCGLRRARTWSDFESEMEPSTIMLISQLYKTVNDIDLYVGAIGEKAVPGAILGPTFQCLVGDQFARLKRGDRFFYEEANQPSSFSLEQLKQIRRTSLARILCDNADDIALMQPLAFVQPSFLDEEESCGETRNQRVSCSSRAIPAMDLRAWANERPAVN